MGKSKILVLEVIYLSSYVYFLKNLKNTCSYAGNPPNKKSWVNDIRCAIMVQFIGPKTVYLKRKIHSKCPKTKFVPFLTLGLIWPPEAKITRFDYVDGPLWHQSIIHLNVHWMYFQSLITYIGYEACLLKLVFMLKKNFCRYLVSLSQSFFFSWSHWPKKTPYWPDTGQKWKPLAKALPPLAKPNRFTKENRRKLSKVLATYWPKVEATGQGLATYWPKREATGPYGH